jgi:hypothetical protein
MLALDTHTRSRRELNGDKYSRTGVEWGGRTLIGLLLRKLHGFLLRGISIEVHLRALAHAIVVSIAFSRPSDWKTFVVSRTNEGAHRNVSVTYSQDHIRLPFSLWAQ